MVPDHNGGDKRDWFGFPLHHSARPHVVGIISLVVLAIAIYARYPKRLAGAWR